MIRLIWHWVTHIIHSQYVSFGLCICIGYTVGTMLTMSLYVPFTVTSVPALASCRLITPSVAIEGIRNNQVYGTIAGDSRLFIGDEMVHAVSGTFIVPAGPLLVHQVTINIPKDVVYVASKKGKKFYSVYAKSAQNIVPENRVYFKTKIEAINAGFTE